MSAVAPIRGPVLERVEAALDRHGSKRSGRLRQCPAHDDRNPSLAVTEADGRVLLKCHAGCETSAVVAALGLELSDLFDEPMAPNRAPSNGRKATPRIERVSPPKTHRIYADLDAVRAAAGRSAGGVVVDQYEYADESGRIVLVVFRIELPDGGWKTFRQASPEGSGWKFSADGVRLVPFHLPQLIAAAAAGDTIHIVEGEKDVLAVEQAMGVATCNAMGAGKSVSQYVEHFSGAYVVRIVADRDDVGRKHAQAWADALRPIVNRVEIVEAAAGKDAADHLEAGFGLDAFVPVDLRDATPYRLVPIGEICPAIDSDFIVKGVLDRGQLCAVIGAPGSSKTFFTLDLAIAPASGTPWRGHRTRRARVVYVASEGARGIQNRIEAMRLRRAFGDPKLISFFVVADVVRLTVDSEDVDRLVESVRAVVSPEGVDLIVIDTLSRSIAGLDENSSEAMTGAVAAADRLRAELGAAVLLVHHQGKDETRGARGHSSLKAALDVEIEVKKLGGDTFSATLSKSRDYETGRTWLHRLEPVEIGIDADGDPVTSCVVIAEDGVEPAQKTRLNVNEQRTHEALCALLRVAAGTSLEPPEAVLKADLHDYVEKRCGVSRDLRRGVVRKGLEGLKKKNLVAVEGDRVFLLGGDA